MFCLAQCFGIVRQWMWDLIVSVPDHCLSFYFESLLRHIYHLTERDTRRLICVALDVRDSVRSGVRII